MVDLASYLKQLEAENEKLEAELERVQKNRDALKREKDALLDKQKPSALDFDPDAFQKKLDAQFNRNSAEVTISREDARSGSKYREAKAAAEKAGVPLKIIDANAAPAKEGRRSSPVKFVKDADSGTCYVNAEMIARHGQARCRQIAAEQGAPTMRAFRSVEDLPHSMQQAHAQAIADRTNLLGDQQ